MPEQREWSPIGRWSPLHAPSFEELVREAGDAVNDLTGRPLDYAVARWRYETSTDGHIAISKILSGRLTANQLRGMKGRYRWQRPPEDAPTLGRSAVGQVEVAYHPSSGPNQARLAGTDTGSDQEAGFAQGGGTPFTNNLEKADDANAKRLELADRLLDDAERLRELLWAPTVDKKAMARSIGDGVQHIEVVEVHRDQPTFADRKTIVTSIAIIVDKVQLILGEATSRAEVLTHSVEARRERLKQVRDEVAERRQARATRDDDEDTGT